jgi:hypothetical protein
MSTNEDKVVYVVHSIDTEGPLYESLEATFDRLKKYLVSILNPLPKTWRRYRTRKWIWEVLRNRQHG